MKWLVADGDRIGAQIGDENRNVLVGKDIRQRTHSVEGGVVVNVGDESRVPNPPRTSDIQRDLERLISLIDGNDSLGVIGIRNRVRELLELYNKLDNRVRVLTILIAIEGVLLIAVLIAVLIQLRGGA